VVFASLVFALRSVASWFYIKGKVQKKNLEETLRSKAILLIPQRLLDYVVAVSHATLQ